MSEAVCTIDCETRSPVSLKDCGAWKYAEAEHTKVMCLCYRLPHWRAGRTGLWHPEFKSVGLAERLDGDLLEFFEWVHDGKPVEAHHASFEAAIWHHKLRPTHWPVIALTQWRCSMAKASAAALPRALADAADALGLSITKDETGKAGMRKMAAPRKPIKDERLQWARQHDPCLECNATGKIKLGRAKAVPCVACGGKGALSDGPPMPTLYHETREQLEDLFAYCRQDVLAEEALSAAVPDLSPEELAVYHLDQAINQRGFQIDMQAVNRALELLAEAAQDLNAQLAIITGGTVTRATQRVRLMKWLCTQGVTLEDTQAATIDAVLADQTVQGAAREALTTLRALGRSSTAKYQTMSDWVGCDGRVRGGLLYHGATTGRFAASGVQMHNLPRGVPALKKVSQPELWTAVLSQDRQTIEAQYGSVLEVLSHGLRGVFVPTPGNQLIVADYAAIEARVLLWLAGDEDGLNIFRSGRDIYLELAMEIYGRPLTKADAVERQLGKAGVLGAGFGMGPTKFVATAATYGIDLVEDILCGACSAPSRNHDFKANHSFVIRDEDQGRITSVRTIEAYRKKFWRVKQFWRDTEDCAIAAVREGGTVTCGYTAWFKRGRFLYCRLPSGRLLSYPDPVVTKQTTPWGKVQPQLSFMGVDTYTRQWTRQRTYSGALVENLTQAVARDIMVAAMLRCEQSAAYTPVLTIHDEICCEVTTGSGSIEEFTGLLTKLPEWAHGCPVSAEGWMDDRYHK